MQTKNSWKNPALEFCLCFEAKVSRSQWNWNPMDDPNEAPCSGLVASVSALWVAPPEVWKAPEMETRTFAYRVQIPLSEWKLLLLRFDPCKDQSSQLFICSPLCWFWLGKGCCKEIFFQLTLWETMGVHQLDRQACLLFPRNKRVTCGLLRDIWQ